MLQRRSSSNDMVLIRSGSRILDLHFGEIWRSRYLLWMLIRRDVVSQYKQTVFGPLWHLLQPLLQTLMYSFVFQQVALVPTHNVAPILFIMSGMILWSFFNACIMNVSRTFVSNASLFGKVYFPRMIVPIAVVCSALFKLLIQFMLLILVSIIMNEQSGKGIDLKIEWLFLPILFFIIMLMALGAGLIIAAITIKFRDIGLMMGFAMQLLMFISPVLYSAALLKDKLGRAFWIISSNPLTSIFELYRQILFSIPSVSGNSILYSFSTAIVLVVIGILVFSKKEKDFIDSI